VSNPLEESDRLAWQATAAVGLLERFGDLLTVALDAVGRGDDAALARALAERDRLVDQLEPLLAALASARETAGAWADASTRATLGEAADAAAAASAATAGAAGAVSATRAAVAVILRPVDEALRHAKHLHLRLADEVGHRVRPPRRDRTPVVLVP
jgi:hypothetical protein